MVHFKSRLLLIAVLLCFSSPTSVFAHCGLGATPSYDDIYGVRYVRSWCRGPCPEDEALFTPFGAYYVGRAHVHMIGTYESNDRKALTKAIQVLRDVQFYSLNTPYNIVLDTAHYEIAAERCHVATRLNYSPYGSRPDIDKLIKNLTALVDQIHWTRTGHGTESPEGLLAPIP